MQNMIFYSNPEGKAQTIKLLKCKYFLQINQTINGSTIHFPDLKMSVFENIPPSQCQIQKKKNLI